MRRWGLLLCLAAGAAFAQAREDTIHWVPPSPIPGPGDFFVRAPKLRTSVMGWALTGSKPEAYEVRCDDPFTSCEVPILRTRSGADEPFGMGSITHSESAAPWRGKRVALRAEVRAGRVGGWGGLWMRVDGKEDRVLAFDNMQNRALRGTSSYQWFSVVLDVPPEAERISFGVLLHGPGALFIHEIRFEVVNDATASTDLMAPLRASTSQSSTSGAF
jgi:hypothetical protein